ncbi:MAG: PD40 domain-containing protein [Chloroflexota bacterium]|nr:PD40 domain-containing protein [Chloroflexota bacterium]
MQANNTDANHSLIEWSPDGKRLAYFDSNGGTLTLWGSAQLPA